MLKNILFKGLCQFVILSCWCFASTDEAWVFVDKDGADAVTCANFGRQASDADERPVSQEALPPREGKGQTLAQAKSSSFEDFFVDPKPISEASAAHDSPSTVAPVTFRKPTVLSRSRVCDDNPEPKTLLGAAAAFPAPQQGKDSKQADLLASGGDLDDLEALPVAGQGIGISLRTQAEIPTAGILAIYRRVGQYPYTRFPNGVVYQRYLWEHYSRTTPPRVVPLGAATYDDEIDPFAIFKEVANGAASLLDPKTWDPRTWYF